MVARQLASGVSLTQSRDGVPHRGAVALARMATRDTFANVKRKEHTVPASELKARCFALLQEVETRGRSFVVTKRGRAIARVAPMPAAQPTALRGTLLHEEGLLAPVDEEWDATA